MATKGSIEEHPKGSGRYRVRARVKGRLKTLASGLSRVAAEECLRAYNRGDSVKRGGITLAQFGETLMGIREKRGHRSVDRDRDRWRHVIETDPIGGVALAVLRRGDVVEWRDRMLGRGLKAQTVKNAVNLLRAALNEALDRELVETNVARDIKVPRAAEATSDEDLSGVLLPAEQLALLQSVPVKSRSLVAVALLTGLRWSELSWLRREDIRGPVLVVRRSRGGGPTKGGKTRRVPLLPPALAAIEAQLSVLPTRCPWLFPGANGEPRKFRPGRWLAWVEAAKIERRIRWHDLRHTCGTSLLAGWWSEDGTRWTLDEVSKMLGHSSVTVTERYARKLDETLLDAAERIVFPSGNRFDRNQVFSAGIAGIPKPEIGGSSPPGSAKKNQAFALALLVAAGSPWELPRSLLRGIRKTSPRSADGLLLRRIAKAWPALVTGDRSGAEPHLSGALRALERVAEGGRR